MSLQNMNVVENLFDSISLIVEKRIQNLEYDKTIICTITDISQAAQNKYKVSENGTTFFEVQGDGTTYAVGDQVRVLVLNGDFTKEKFIQGKYSGSAGSDKPITYVSAFDSVLQITDNLISDEIASQTYGIAANGPLEETDVIATISLDASVIQNPDLFDTLFLSAEFQTDFDRYPMRTGEFGLHLSLVSSHEDANSDTSIVEIYHLYLKSSENMFGNPYNFKIFSQQDIAYSLSHWPKNVSHILISLYQDNQFQYQSENSFTNELERYVPAKFDNDEITISDIKVKNIKIGFGNKITADSGTLVKIYSNDNLNYQTGVPGVSTERGIQLLWSNKDANNSYLGFSDGIADAEYDEDAYIKAASKNSKLLAQQSIKYPADEISLTLAANINDIETIVKKAINTISIDLNSLLDGFNRYTNKVWDAEFAKLLGGDSNTSSVGKIATSIENNIKLLVNLYDNTLQCAKGVEDIELTEIETGKDAESLKDAIVNSIEETKAAIESLLIIIDRDTEVGKDNASYRNIYENYDRKLENVTQRLESYKTSINTCFDPDTTIIENAADGENIDNSSDETKDKLEVTEILSKYSDGVILMAIRKYIEDSKIENTTPETGDEPAEASLEEPSEPDLEGDEPAAADTLTSLNLSLYTNYVDKTKTEEFQQTQDNRYCIYWYRYDEQYNEKDPHVSDCWERLDKNNIGIPTKDEEDKGEYLPVRCLTNDANKEVKIEMRPRPTEKFKAVLFKNHEKYESNELIFTNLTNILDSQITDAIGALSIEHYNNDSRNSYQSYNDIGNLINAADYYKKRELRVRFSGESGEDEQLIGSTVYWYIPKTSTMLTVFPSEVNSRFISLTSEESDFYKEGYNCYYQIIGSNEDETIKIIDTTFPYHIKDYYIPTATQNTILCTVQKGDNTYVAEQRFEFSAFGSNGTNYTLVLSPTDEQFMVTDNKELVIDISLYDYSRDKVEITELGETPTLSFIGPSGYVQTSRLEDTKLVGCLVSKKENSNIYAGILHCSFKNMGVSIGGIEQKLNLSTDLAIPYGIHKNLYMEGASSVLYDSFGSCPSYYKKSYNLYNKTTGERLDNLNWDIEYYCGDDNEKNQLIYSLTNDIELNILKFKLNTDGVELTLRSSINYGEAQYSTLSIKNNETPKAIFATDVELSLDSNAISKLYDAISYNYIPRLNDDKTLSPSAMYIEYTKLDQAIYPVVIATVADTETDAKIGNAALAAGTLVWAQPIIVSQYKYGSSVLNSWDGSMKLDEENGTILSTMVGAGRKNANNKFEGVLMGDVATGSGDNAINDIGLYGFHDGAQSFGFKVDGTAFLGKASSGRIYIDGNNAFLYSASWLNGRKPICDSNNTNAAFKDDGSPKSGEKGMLIDLNTGQIDAHNFKLTSNEITLNSNPGTNEYYMIVGKPGGSKLTLDNSHTLALATDGKELLHVGEDEYYLQSFNYDEEGKQGIRFNLRDGEDNAYLKAYNFALETTDIYLGDEPYPLSKSIGGSEISKDNWKFIIGDNFGVDASGHVYANNGNLCGTIKATAGRIGGPGENRRKNLLRISELVHAHGVEKFSESERKILLRKNTAYGGTYIDTNSANLKLKPETIYTLSYKFKKVYGTLLNIGGHSDQWEQVELKINGDICNDKSYNKAGSIELEDSTNIHTVSFSFKKKQTSGEENPNYNIYIQPNRGDATELIYELWDVKLEEGLGDTEWCPVGEDYWHLGQEGIYKQDVSGNIDVGMLSTQARLPYGLDNVCFSAGYTLTEVKNTTTKTLAVGGIDKWTPFVGNNYQNIDFGDSNNIEVECKTVKSSDSLDGILNAEAGVESAQGAPVSYTIPENLNPEQIQGIIIEDFQLYQNGWNVTSAIAGVSYDIKRNNNIITVIPDVGFGFTNNIKTDFTYQLKLQYTYVEKAIIDTYSSFNTVIIKCRAASGYKVSDSSRFKINITATADIVSPSFYVLRDGSIYATAGEVGGWKIDGDKLSGGKIISEDAGGHTIQIGGGRITVSTGSASVPNGEIGSTGQGCWFGGRWLFENNLYLNNGKFQAGYGPNNISTSFYPVDDLTGLTGWVQTGVGHYILFVNGIAVRHSSKAPSENSYYYDVIS